MQPTTDHLPAAAGKHPASPRGQSQVQASARQVADEAADPAEPPGPENGARGRVLFAGQAYYNTWYLSRELRKLGWKADVLNWDTEPAHQIHYHGEDFILDSSRKRALPAHLLFYLRALSGYDIFHFSSMNGMRFSHLLHEGFKRTLGYGAEIRLLKRLGKVVTYSGNGCLDGVAKSSYAAWGDRPICADCSWRDRPDVCSDEGNLAWGKFRNGMADFQVLMGGNRVDYNEDPRCHEVPEFFCLDSDFWRPGLEIPEEFRLPISEETVKIYHGVGNFDLRSDPQTMRNFKSTHIYVPLIEQLKQEGHDIELVFCKDLHNRDVRFYQAQSDIVCDMLTAGYYGANVREALMLGKPVICYMRDEWIDRMRDEIPDYVDELPIVSATPETVHDVLVDLIEHPEKRAEIGRRSREFALRWHSSTVAAQRFDQIFRGLLAGRPGTSSFR